MKSIIVDERITPEINRGLLRLGLTPVTLPPSPRLGEAIASHPDSLIFKYRDEIITSADYCDAAPHVFTDIRERHPHIKVTFTADTLGSRYPEDTKFNALLCGGELFLREASISGEILRLAERCGIRVSSVKQGYPACSVLSLGDGAILSDRGMAKVLSSRGITVTQIREGHISLPSYAYGFIGGASFVFEDKVCFFGDYRLHPDGELIEGAVLAAGLTPISLADAPLTDLGGAVLLE